MAFVIAALAASAVLSAAGSVLSSNSAAAQNQNAAAWANYNAQMGYNNNQANMRSQAMLSMFNTSLKLKAAERNAEAAMDVAEFNAGQVQATEAYNSVLLDEELRLLWEAEGLDQRVLAKQRERERGDIVGRQASSGITIGEGSHQDVVVAQRAAEMQDAFVIMHNADIGASKILNAQAQGAWQAESQIQKIMYEGEMGSVMSVNNARLEAAAGMMETTVGYDSGMRSADFALASELSSASQQWSANDAQRSSNLTSGLFSAASSAVSAAAVASTAPALTTSLSGNTQYVPY